MIAKRVSLKLKNSLSELETMCQSLEEFGQALGLPDKTLFHICLALEELVGNIISHGYTDDDVHWINIAISHKDGVLEIRVEDDGTPFDPCLAEEPDCQCPVEQRKVGNLGIHLARKVMDDMVYERSGGMNVVTLRKDLEVA
jgi:anti-sigma regulatory factor (Ser/Thr protein kinase)